MPNTRSQPGTRGRVISRVTTRPPGIVTRRISARPRARSTRLRTTKAEVTAANTRSRKGSASASAASSGTRVSPRRASLGRAWCSMPSEKSTPTTIDAGRRRQRVADARDAQRRPDAEARGQRVQAVGTVERHVLARVDQVEAGDPHREREPEHEHGRIEAAAHGDPAAGGGDAIGEAEDP